MKGSITTTSETPQSGDAQNDPLSDTICVCGTGRGGTTIFFKVLGTHPDLGWVSNIVERYPKYPQLSLLSRLHPLAVKLRPDSKIGQFLPRPAESLTSLRLCSDGLFQLPRELNAGEILPETIATVRHYHERVLSLHGAERLTVKHTGFPRFQFWRTVLNDPRFLHVIRDGRAVAHSMMRVSWWDGTMDSWWWGTMPDRYMSEYENSGRRPAVLAAIVWKHLLDMYDAESRKAVDLPILNVRYDDFSRDPVGQMRQVAEFCDLTFPDKFRDAIGQFSIRNADVAWRNGFNKEDLDAVELVLGEHLERYGFT